MSNLATYRLPQRRPQQRWLDACIRDAVANLDEAPFLQASSVTPEPQLQRFAVSPQVGDAPQLWDGIVRHLSNSGAETSSVLYVSPVVISDSDASADAVSCMAQAACDSAREVLTGIATGSDAPPILEGRIGDCCEGHPPDMARSHGLLGGPQHASFDSFSSMGASLDSEQHAAAPHQHGYKHSFVKASQIVPYVPLRRGGRAHGPAAFNHLPEGRVRAGSSDDGQLQRLWGVVVQSQEAGGMDGCYVLKTVSSTAADCQCTSYTLTKVCEGDLARQDLARAWL